MDTRIVRKGVKPSSCEILGQRKAPSNPATVTRTDIKARRSGGMWSVVFAYNILTPLTVAMASLSRNQARRKRRMSGSWGVRRMVRQRDIQECDM